MIRLPKLSPQWPIFRPAQLLKLVGLVALFLVVGILAQRWWQSRTVIHEFNPDTSHRQFVMGNDILDIPINLMRFERQRSKTVLRQADLVVSWPSGAGFGPDNAAAFLHPDRTKDLIFMTLLERELPFEMSDRLIPIYSKLYSGPAKPGPAGLTLRTLRTGSGYDGEELAISQSAHPTWVARCQIEKSTNDATCLRDIFVGAGLSLRYRFSRSLLSHWQAVENLVTSRMSTIVITK